MPSFSKFASFTSKAAGKPAAFLLAASSMMLWAALGPYFNYSDSWSLAVNTGTTIVTFLMVFLIQNSQNRDGAAIQAKLDAIIKAMPGPDDLIGLDRKTEAEIEAARAECEP